MNKRQSSPPPQPKSRQSYNIQCADLLSASVWGRVNPVAMDTIYQFIYQHPDQRMGQIICNYIYPEYRKMDSTVPCREFLAKYFPIKGDPFYEEPDITLARWEKMAEEALRESAL